VVIDVETRHTDMRVIRLVEHWMVEDPSLDVATIHICYLEATIMDSEQLTTEIASCWSSYASGDGKRIPFIITITSL